MANGDAEGRVEMPVATPEGRGRNPREYGEVRQAPRPATEDSHPERQMLMKEVVGQENMLAAHKRVCANKGAPGIDGMRVEEVYFYGLDVALQQTGFSGPGSRSALRATGAARVSPPGHHGKTPSPFPGIPPAVGG
jgi:hypothetical protein